MPKTVDRDSDSRIKREIAYFSILEHVWWGAITPAGQKRYDNKLELLKKMCKINTKTRILEVGSGVGEFTKRLAKLNAQITAVDITPKLIEKGKRSIKAKNIQFKINNCEDLDFKSNSFDIVCGVSILHHVDPEKTLKETYRVLKSDGEIFFTEPNLMNPHTFLGLHIPQLRKKMEFSPDETALLRWQLIRILKQTGFKKIQVVNYDFLHPKTPERLIGLVEKIGSILEKIPLAKEVSGSLLIHAKK